MRSGLWIPLSVQIADSSLGTETRRRQSRALRWLVVQKVPKSSRLSLSDLLQARYQVDDDNKQEKPAAHPGEGFECSRPVCAMNVLPDDLDFPGRQSIGYRVVGIDQQRHCVFVLVVEYDPEPNPYRPAHSEREFPRVPVGNVRSNTFGLETKACTVRFRRTLVLC